MQEETYVTSEQCNEKSEEIARILERTTNKLDELDKKTTKHEGYHEGISGTILLATWVAVGLAIVAGVFSILAWFLKG